MTLLQMCILFIAAFLGGMLNSVAGGGSFIGFPSLVFTGVPPINANATNTIALWPGVVASTGAYRRELTKQNRALILVLSGTSLIGGVLGAILLLRTSQATFIRLVPYLLLMATLLFAFSGPITSRLRGRKPAEAAGAVEKTSISWFKLAGIALLQFIIAIYGGYFGGGIGILMLATLGLMGMENIHEMNGMKSLLSSVINGVAVITFVIAGAVFWPQAIVMIIGAIIGGYGGAYYARKIKPTWVRVFVILVGVGMTIYFFFK